MQWSLDNPDLRLVRKILGANVAQYFPIIIIIIIIIIIVVVVVVVVIIIIITQ